MILHKKIKIRKSSITHETSIIKIITIITIIIVLITTLAYIANYMCKACSSLLLLMSVINRLCIPEVLVVFQYQPHLERRGINIMPIFVNNRRSRIEEEENLLIINHHLSLIVIIVYVSIEY